MSVSKKARDEYELILEAILPAYINHLLKEGKIKKEDLPDKKRVLQKILDYIDNHNIEYQYAVDHRVNLLKNANNFYNSDYDLSLTLYSTYIEHTINSIIDLYCREKSIGDKTRNEIVRNINILGKFTWLIELINLPKINEKKIVSIKKITESRNSYIHYKWNYTKFDDEKIENRISHSEIKSTIKYLKTYESKLEFRGLKNKIKI